MRSTRRNSLGAASLFVAAWSCTVATACGPGPVPSAQAAPIPRAVIDDDAVQDSTLVTPYQTTVEFQNAPPAGTITPSNTDRLVIQFLSGFCNETNGVPTHSVRVPANVDHYFAPSITLDTGNNNGYSGFYASDPHVSEPRIKPQPHGLSYHSYCD